MDINISGTKTISYLQQKPVNRHTCNIEYSTTSDSYYKEKVFPDGKCLYSTITDVAQSIICTTIKPKNFNHTKCDFFCDE